VIFHKLLPLFLLPLGLALVLGLAGYFFRRKALAISGWMVLALASLPATGKFFLGILENRHPRLAPADCPATSAVVVLSGSMKLDFPAGERPRPFFSDGSERFFRGVELYRLGKGSRLILTGGALPWGEPGPTEGELLRGEAEERGVTASHILVTPPVRNTREEAREVKRLLAQTNLTEPVLLVTSAFHLPRAVQLFRREGVQVIPFPCDYKAAALPPGFRFPLPLAWVPSAEGLLQTSLAWREFYGIIFYRFIHLFSL